MSKIKEYLKERLIILGGSTPGEWEKGEVINWGDENDVPQAPILCEGRSITWDDHGGEVFKPDDAVAIADAHNELPRILSALVSVLELHKPEAYSDCLTGEAGTVCSDCFDVDVQVYAEYPCRTVSVIAKELGVEIYYG